MKGSGWIWVGLLAPTLALAAPQGGTGGIANGTGGSGNAGAGVTQNGGAPGTVNENGNGTAGSNAAPAAGPATRVAERGILQGTVADVDYGAGKLELAIGGREVVLRGTPGQLQLFRQGEFATLPYVQLAGNRWLATSSNQLAPQYFADATTVIGTVRKVDKSGGLVTLTHDHQKLNYLASPQLIQGLLPGQFVSLTYESIGGHRWVQQIKPVQRTNTGKQ